MQSGNRSSYFKRLDGLVKERYLLKLKHVGGLDPFAITGFHRTIEAMPPVNSHTIQEYLVHRHSFYDLEPYMALKPLEAGKNFVASGKVFELKSRRVLQNFILRGKVHPSMKSTESPREAWAIVNHVGRVLCAHCTCMAGCGEVCSHISAMLFAVVYWRESVEICSVTGKPAQWVQPSNGTKAAMSSIRNINFGTPDRIILERQQGIVKRPRVPKINYPPPSDDVFHKMIKTCYDSGITSSMMSLMEPFAELVNAQRAETLKSLYRPSHETKTLAELRDFAQGVNLSVSEEDARKIEEATRKQARGRAFFNQRAGKASASKFKAICNTSTDEDSISMSLLKSVTDPFRSKFSCNATRYGCKFEKNAIAAYKGVMVKSHRNFTVSNCGSFCNPKYPEFIGTPDALVECLCCGKGCLEVKCPYCLKDVDQSTLEDILRKNSAKHPVSLTGDETTGTDQYELKKSHAYFYQVQCQLFLTGRPYSDFVIWTPHTKPIIVRTLPDLDFWERESPKAIYYIRNIALPELIGKYFTRLAAKKKREEEWERTQGVRAPCTGVPKLKKKKKKQQPQTTSNPQPSTCITPLQITQNVSVPNSILIPSKNHRVVVTNSQQTLMKASTTVTPTSNTPTPPTVKKLGFTPNSGIILNRAPPKAGTIFIPNSHQIPVKASSTVTPTSNTKTPLTVRKPLSILKSGYIVKRVPPKTYTAVASNSQQTLIKASGALTPTTFNSLAQLTVRKLLTTPNSANIENRAPPTTQTLVMRNSQQTPMKVTTAFTPTPSKTQTPLPVRKPLSSLNLCNILNRVGDMDQ